MTTNPSNLIPVSLAKQQELRIGGLHRQARTWKARAQAAEQARDAEQASAIAVHTAALTLVREMAKPAPATTIVTLPKHMQPITASKIVAGTITAKYLAPPVTPEGMRAVAERMERPTLEAAWVSANSENASLKRDLADALANAEHAAGRLAKARAGRDRDNAELTAERDQARDELGTLRHDLETVQRMMGENAEADAKKLAELEAALERYRDPARARVTAGVQFFPNDAMQADYAEQLNASERPAVHIGGRAAGKTVEGLMLERDATAAKLAHTEAALDRLHTACANETEGREMAEHALAIALNERNDEQAARAAAEHYSSASLARVRELEAEADSLRETIAGQHAEIEQIQNGAEWSRQQAANAITARTAAELDAASAWQQVRELDAALVNHQNANATFSETLAGLRVTNHDNAESAVTHKRRVEELDTILAAVRDDLAHAQTTNASLVTQLDVKAGSERALANALDAVRDLQDKIQQLGAPIAASERIRNIATDAENTMVTVHSVLSADNALPPRTDARKHLAALTSGVIVQLAAIATMH